MSPFVDLREAAEAVARGFSEGWPDAELVTCPLADGGEGYTSFSIASPTGDGLTRARTFTRERRCTLVDYFRIV